MENDDKYLGYLDNQIEQSQIALATAQKRMNDFKELVDMENLRIDILNAARYAYKTINKVKTNDDSNREEGTG